MLNEKSRKTEKMRFANTRGTSGRVRQRTYTDAADKIQLQFHDAKWRFKSKKKKKYTIPIYLHTVNEI